MAVATSTAIALALAAASAGAGVYNSNRVASQQDQQAAAGIRQQSVNQQEINSRVNRTIQDVQKSDPEATKNAVTEGYLAQVRNKLAQAKSGVATDSGLSSAYNDAATKAGGQVDDYAATTAGLFGRMDAPGVQRQDEAFQYGNLGMDLDVSRGRVQGDQFLNQLRMQGIRRNPWIDAAAGVAGGASQGLMASGGNNGYAPGYSATNTGTIAPTRYFNSSPWSLPAYVPGGG